MSNSVTVKICGEEFKLITDDSIEYTQSVGSRVSAEMQKMLAKRVGRMDAAIMAALNIADELFKMRETDEQLRAQIKSALDEAAAAKAEVNALKRESVNLQKRLEKAEKAQK
ncbi:MAG: cell division protein ZapA, partial [Oscillibacter sp.]|nr:cell division protein ZapA [Oscillibacter sp.]